MGNFSDVFKAVFATTKTTATHLPVVTSAGAPDGIISTSDLASVLGVPNQLSANTDLDSILTSGTFYTIANTTNAPDTGVAFLEVISLNANRRLQRYTSLTYKAVYIRSISTSGGTWSDWVKVGGGS